MSIPDRAAVRRAGWTRTWGGGRFAPHSRPCGPIIQERRFSMSDSFEIRNPFEPNSERITRRRATEEELRYLRRFNRIRLLRHVMFAANFILYGALFGLILWLSGLIASMGSVMIALGAAMALLMGGLWFWWWRPVLPDFLRTRLLLRVPDRVEVVCFRDKLGVTYHPTWTTDSIVVTRGRIVEFPPHWESEGARLWEGDAPLEIARVPGASGKVLRLPILMKPGRHRIDAILPDLGDFVLRAGDLSIAKEMRAGLPLLRAHTAPAVFAFSAGVIALLAGLTFWVLTDMRDDDAEQLQLKIAGITWAYEGGEVPADALAARGIAGLRPDPEFGARALHADAPLTVYEVSLTPNGEVFYLTEGEFAVAVRMSAVAPGTLPGSRGADPELIAEYRALLMRRAEALAPRAPGAPALVAALPDDLVAAQLLALSWSNRPDKRFFIALLPEPVISRAAAGSPYLTVVRPPCYPGDVLCGQREKPQTREAPFFVMEDQRITMRRGAEAEHLAKLLAEQRALEAQTWQVTGLKACAAVILLAALALLICYLARERVRRWHRETGVSAAA